MSCLNRLRRGFVKKYHKAGALYGGSDEEE